MQVLHSLLWGNVSKYCFCNSITNLQLCGQSVPSTLNFLQGLQMIKQITCLHISKLTLLDNVIENCSAHKGAGVHLQAVETHVNTLTQATISSLHTPTTTVHLKAFLTSKGVTQSYRSYHGVQRKVTALESDFGMVQVLWGDAWGRNQNWGKGKITVTKGETSLGKSGLW